MPRFPQSKRFKGFAFVEFGSVDAAKSASEAALARDPALLGLRAMPKAQWQEMKRQLKEQLAAASTEHAHDDHGPRAKRAGEEDEELEGSEELEGNEELEHGARASRRAPPNAHMPQKKPKRKSGHIRFATNSDDDESDCINDDDDASEALLPASSETAAKRQRAH